MSGNILTIDIRDEAISALLISSGLKGNRIESHCHVRLDQAPPDTENPLLWALSRIAESMDTAGATGILSVSPSDVTYRNVTVPFKERRKISQTLPFELESTLPGAIEELVIDFDIVRKSDYSDVLAAAVKTDIVETLVEAAKSMGIRPGFVSVGPVAEAMCIARLGLKKIENFLFVSIDDSCATACIVLSGKLHLARTFRLPNSASGHRPGRLKKELPRLIAAFENIFDSDCQFDEIMVSCVSSKITGEASDREVGDIVSALEDQFDTPVRTIDMLQDANLKMLAGPGKGAGEGAFDARLYNAALGLSAIETGRITPFDFSRSHYFIQKYWHENKTELITTGMLVVFVFVMIMAKAIFQVRSLESQVRKLDSEIVSIFRSTFPDNTRIVDPLHQMRSEIEQIRQRSALSGSHGNIPNIDLLNEISRVIPHDIDVLITNMVRSEDHVSISGTIATFHAVDEVKGRLEKIDLFERIIISSANMDNTINRVRFRIRADMAGI